MGLLTLALTQRPEGFIRIAEAASSLIEGMGILIILGGSLYALALAAFGKDHRPRQTQHPDDDRYHALRRRLGRAILLGLEFLVAADIIATVLVRPTISSATSLAIIVVIRTFLSWSLEMEISGRWPWQSEPKNDGSR